MQVTVLFLNVVDFAKSIMVKTSSEVHESEEGGRERERRGRERQEEEDRE